MPPGFVVAPGLQWIARRDPEAVVGVMIEAGGRAEEVAAAIRALGFVPRVSPSVPVVSVELPVGLLDRIAALPGVVYIDGGGRLGL